MTEPNPDFDTVHPSGHVLFRSCRGGPLHSVTLDDAAMEADAHTLAEAIMLAANVSFLQAALEIRGEVVAAGHTPSAALPTPDDLDAAVDTLQAHRLHHHDDQGAHARIRSAG